jgi:hypothetical protein
MARLRRGKGLKSLAHQGADIVTLSLFVPADQKAGKPAEPEQPSIADEVLAKAEAAIDRLAAEYPRHAGRDIADMDRYAENMASDQDNRTAHYNEILRIAHDVRGQGALFGYPLITRCAGSLCRATRLLEAHDRVVLDIVRAHVAAMQAILETGVNGVENRTALAIAAGLEMLVSSRVDR